MVVVSALVLCAVSLSALGFPSADSHKQKGVLIVAPPRVNNTGSIVIPDPAHPFIAPGPDDQRGPCPGLNTLANHGFIPRNGIASFADIVNATGHAFNMDYDLAGALTAFGMLARGNAFTDQLSIGLESPLVPPLPGEIDGPVARGLGTHGRFEGDVSMTRQDAAIGDNVHFQPALYAELLNITAQLGNDSDVTGPHSVVNIPVMTAFKFRRFTDSQTQDVQLQYHVGRLLLSYGETSFTLNFFANGTDNVLSVDTMTSFFQDQTFPRNWHRRATAADINFIGDTADTVFAGRPVAPGANNASDFYIQDPGPFNGCALYNNLGAENVPAVLLNTTGILKKNVDFLLNAIHAVFSDCPFATPTGAADV